jgi:hypothetical protein
MRDNELETPSPAGESEYEAPGIEAVLTPEELEREVLYGGGASPDVCAP